MAWVRKRVHSFSSHSQNEGIYNINTLSSASLHEDYSDTTSTSKHHIPDIHVHLSAVYDT